MTTTHILKEDSANANTKVSFAITPNTSSITTTRLTNSGNTNNNNNNNNNISCREDIHPNNNDRSKDYNTTITDPNSSARYDPYPSVEKAKPLVKRKSESSFQSEEATEKSTSFDSSSNDGKYYPTGYNYSTSSSLDPIRDSTASTSSSSTSSTCTKTPEIIQEESLDCHSNNTSSTTQHYKTSGSNKKVSGDHCSNNTATEQQDHVLVVDPSESTPVSKTSGGKISQQHKLQHKEINRSLQPLPPPPPQSQQLQPKQASTQQQRQQQQHPKSTIPLHPKPSKYQLKQQQDQLRKEEQHQQIYLNEVQCTFPTNQDLSRNNNHYDNTTVNMAQYNNEYHHQQQHSNTNGILPHVPQQQHQQQQNSHHHHQQQQQHHQQQQVQTTNPNMSNHPTQYNNNRAHQNRSSTMSSNEGTPLKRPIPNINLNDTNTHTLGGGGTNGTSTNLTGGTTTSIPGSQGPIPGSLVPSPTLYLDRLESETTHIHEMNQMSQKLQTQDQELTHLKSIHDDLEGRLEHQTQQRMRLEEMLERQEISWARQCHSLERERDSWEKKVQAEETKNMQLKNFVYRKEKEIQKMIQRKYEPSSQPHGHQRSTNTHRNIFDRNTASSSSSNNNNNNPQRQQQQSTNQQQSQPGTERHITPMSQRSPHEILEFSEAMQAAREQYACKNLLDFFGVG